LKSCCAVVQSEPSKFSKIGFALWLVILALLLGLLPCLLVALACLFYKNLKHQRGKYISVARHISSGKNSILEI